MRVQTLLRRLQELWLREVAVVAGRAQRNQQRRPGAEELDSQEVMEAQGFAADRHEWLEEGRESFVAAELPMARLESPGCLDLAWAGPARIGRKRQPS